MRTLFNLFNILLAFSAAGQWVTLNSGTLNELDAVLMDDASTYWVGGEDGILMKTTDGGNTWTTQMLTEAGEIEAILRLNATTLLLAADDGLVGRSTDNGSTWTFIDTGAPNVLYAITNAGDHVWASGRDGGLVYSADQGLTWTLQNSGTSERLHGIKALDAMNVVAVGREGVIIHTGDGGNNWSLSVLPGGEDHRAIIFLDNAERTGLIAGPAGEILRSTDEGATWTAVSTPTGLEAQALASEDPGVVYAVGDNALILVSNDQGVSWQTMTSTATGELSGVDVKNGVAIAVGINGTILKLDGDVGIHNNGIKDLEGNMSIFPNPGTGPVTIELSDMRMSERGLSLELFTLDGRMVDKAAWPAGKIKAVIQHLDAGSYLVRLVGDNGASLQKRLIHTGR